MTAWEKLIANSTLGSGTAAQHFLAQNTGTGGEGAQYFGALEVFMSEEAMQVELVDELTVTVDEAIISVALEEDVIEVTLDDC